MALGDDMVIVIPLWRRTKHIERVYASAMWATPGARVLFVASEGDEEVRAALDAFHADHLLVDGPGGGFGDYAIKINAGYRASTEPLIFTGADDLAFHPGWYEAARSLIETPTPDYCYAKGDWPVSVVGTNDLCNPRTMRGEHSTHSLVARWYADIGASIDADHEIYAPCYVHEYCDDELVQVAMSRQSYAHAFDAHVEHLHPLAGKSPDDLTYQRGRAHSRLSRRKFVVRQRLWTGG